MTNIHWIGLSISKWYSDYINTTEAFSTFIHASPAKTAIDTNSDQRYITPMEGNFAYFIMTRKMNTRRSVGLFHPQPSTKKFTRWKDPTLKRVYNSQYQGMLLDDQQSSHVGEHTKKTCNALMLFSTNSRSMTTLSHRQKQAAAWFDGLLNIVSSPYWQLSFRITIQDNTPRCSKTARVWCATAPKQTPVRWTDKELLFHCDSQTQWLQKVHLKSSSRINAIITAHKTIQQTPLIRDNGTHICRSIACKATNEAWDFY